MKKLPPFIPYIPLLSVGLYALLFTIAASLYPGGSDNFPHATDGYSIMHNFLCDANNEITHSGLVNTGRSIAVLAHFALSMSLISFFYIYPNVFDHSNRNTRLIRWFGVVTFSIFILMYREEWHDTIVTISGILGTLTFIPIFRELKHMPIAGFRWLTRMVYAGSILIFLIFETKIGIYSLPFLEKIVFGVDAMLIVWTSLIVIAKQKESRIRSQPEQSSPLGNSVSEDIALGGVMLNNIKNENLK